MRHTAAFRAVALATLLLFSISCVSTHVPPISSQGSGFRPLRDERELWGQSRAEEGKLLAHVRLYDDARLDAYLERVVSRLNPPAHGRQPGRPLPGAGDRGPDAQRLLLSRTARSMSTRGCSPAWTTRTSWRRCSATR